MITSYFCLPGGWKNVLGGIADDPRKSNPGIIQHVDDTVVVISDAFPKARTHLLIIAKDRSVDCVNDLTKAHIPLLQKMLSVAMDLIAKLRQSSPIYPYLVGFHALPSIHRLHCHILSSDLDSEKMKKKKHWNSFTTPFFIPLTKVIATLEENKVMNISQVTANECLEVDLRCHHCCTEMRNMPLLKEHIMECTSKEWAKSVQNAFLCC